MPVTGHDVEAAWEAAVACARAAGRFLLDYCEPLQENPPYHPLGSFQEQAARDMRNLHMLLKRCGENVTRAVLSQILFANSHRDYHAVFDGYEFPTFHELACAAAEMTHVTLSLLAEDHPRGESDPEVLAELLRFELLAHKRRYADFRSDRVIASIEREAAAAVRYLAEHNEDDLPNRALPGRALSQPHPDPDPKILARNEWIYNQRCKHKTWSQIAMELKDAGFSIISSPGGLRRAAKLHAIANGLPLAPSLPPGRPRNK